MKSAKTLLLAVAALVALPQLANAEWSEVRIATEAAYPPFAYKTESGELAGFDIDFTHAVCAQMKVHCEIVEQDWDGLIPALLVKKYDAIIASMSITDKRKKQVDFSERYYRDPARFVAHKDAGLEDTNAGLAGKAIGVLRATTHQEYLETNFPDADLRLYTTQEEVYLDLTTGRLDAAVANGIATEFSFLKSDEGKDYAFFGGVHYDPAIHGEGTGIALRQEDDELREMFNRAIEEMRANGSYQAINDKYFSFDIYGE
ncbi:MAG: ABC transporter substrate-binding protein [Pseudomonadota bacterium]